MEELTDPAHAKVFELAERIRVATDGETVGDVITACIVMATLAMFSADQDEPGSLDRMLKESVQCMRTLVKRNKPHAHRLGLGEYEN